MNRMAVTAVARYLPEESDPEVSRYVFAYRIEIHNEGEIAAQLVTRHWWVTDGSGEVQEVHGSGVVGQQPLIATGASFEYTSGAVLETPVGAMHGYYEFVDEQGRSFEAAIPAFSLSVPNMRH